MSTSPNRRRSLIHGVVTACRRLLDCSEHRGIPDAGCHVVACHLFVTSQGVASNFLDGADDGFAADPDTGGFSVPPKEPPTIRSTPPMAEPQISWLIANAHDPSSGDCYSGDELMPAWMELRGWPGYALAMPENSGPVGDFVVKKGRSVLLP